jgi:membrane-associated phospholipid phosphatase
VRTVVCLIGILFSAHIAAAQPAAPASPAQQTEAASAVGDQTVTLLELFTGLGHDLTRLPSTGDALTLAAGGALSIAVHQEDASLTRRAHASEPLDEVFDAGAKTGSGWVQVGGAVAVYAVGRIGKYGRMTEVGADLVQAQVLNTVITTGLKVAVDRTRPDQGKYSFPSGHTSSTFASATVLQRQLGWKVGAPAYAVALYVGASRMTENRHFASDIIFGAALGVVAGRTVTVGHGGGRFALAPTLVPGGAAVLFNHLN